MNNKHVDENAEQLVISTGEVTDDSIVIATGDACTMETDDAQGTMETIDATTIETNVTTNESQVIYVISNPRTESQEGEEHAPLSFVALVPGPEGQVTCVSHDTENDGSLQYVALVPDSTHYAPPISSQEEECSLTLKELTARERTKLIKRTQRQNPEFRDKERTKTRQSMAEKRKDPAYREMERKKDRERRRQARLNNSTLREKERARDREYRRRVKPVLPPKSSGELESSSLESFMNDMDERCQLLISCKPDEGHEENIYTFNKNNFVEDLQHSAFSSENVRTDLIGQYSDGDIQSEIMTEKDGENRTMSYMSFIT